MRTFHVSFFKMRLFPWKTTQFWSPAPKEIILKMILYLPQILKLYYSPSSCLSISRIVCWLCVHFLSQWFTVIERYKLKKGSVICRVTLLGKLWGLPTSWQREILSIAPHSQYVSIVTYYEALKGQVVQVNCLYIFLRPISKNRRNTTCGPVPSEL